MLAIYETVNRRLTRADEIEEGTWICLTAPSQEEIREVAATLDIEPADVQAALDPEESARISLEDGYTVIIVDIPLKVDGAAEGVYHSPWYSVDPDHHHHGLLRRYPRIV